MKPQTRWVVIESGKIISVDHSEDIAERCAETGRRHGFAPEVVEVTLTPAADLERLVRAARTIASEIDTPVTAHSSEAIAELDNALAPFTGDADAMATD